MEVKFKGAFYQTLIHCIAVPDLNTFELTEEGLVVGAAVTLTSLAQELAKLVDKLPGRLSGQPCIEVPLRLFMYSIAVLGCIGYKTGLFSAVLEMLRWFAGQQIRNMAVSERLCYFSSMFQGLFLPIYCRLWVVMCVMPVLYLTSLLCLEQLVQKSSWHLLLASGLCRSILNSSLATNVLL